jgi:hypothetical protein
MVWQMVASPKLHKLSHDHPDHITSNTITAIQVLEYATSVPNCLTGVATTRHTRPSNRSSLQLGINPTTQHEAYNSAQGLQLGMKPTTRHEAYNSAQGLQLGMKPTTRHKERSLQLGTKAYKKLLFKFYYQLPLTKRILEPCFRLLHVPMHPIKCHETLLLPNH